MKMQNLLTFGLLIALGRSTTNPSVTGAGEKPSKIVTGPVPRADNRQPLQMIVVERIGEATEDQCKVGVYIAPGLSHEAVEFIRKYGRPVTEAQRKPHEEKIPRGAFCIKNPEWLKTSDDH